MSYTPINWQTGETITAEKLNKMDNGWGIGNAQLFSETVTTSAQSGMFGATLEYASPIDSNTIKVTFNNDEYICDRIDAFGGYYYGGFSENGPDFSEYPFLLECDPSVPENHIFTRTAGTFSVVVSVDGAIVISDNFRNAVEAVFKGTQFPFLCVSGETTYSEMHEAAVSGRLLYFYDNNGRCHFITLFMGYSGTDSVEAVPAGVSETYGFDANMIFTVYTT